VIALHGLGYRSGRSVLLDEVTAQFPGGSLCAVLGPNGAGKSTLLKLVAGELKPSTGNIEIAGRALSAWRPAELARIRAVVAQFNPLEFPYTCAEVVALGRAPHRAFERRAEQSAAVARALALVDSSAFAERLYPSLSGGEQQRIAVARAFAQVDAQAGPVGTRYLLLDEPTASLDLAHQPAARPQSRSRLC
jgi:iron complex transport system ATP-binding protein